MSKQEFNSYAFQPPMFFCPACGEKIREGISFCGKCGTQVGSSKKPKPETSEKKEIGALPSSAYSYQQKKKVKYADFGDRLLAFIIDSIIISIVASILGGMIGVGVSPFTINLQDSWRWIIALPYFWIGAYYGQTVGKMAMHLKTVHEDSHKQLDGMQSFLHVVGKVFFLPLDVILSWIIEDKDVEEQGKVRITQRISKSVVIKIA